MTPSAPLTLFSLLPTATTATPNRASDSALPTRIVPTGNVIEQLPAQRQAHLQAVAAKVEAQNTRVLLDVLVKQQQPVDAALRRVLQQQLSQFQPPPQSSGQDNLQTLLNGKQLYLTKLLVQGKTQWAISRQPVPVDKPLNITVTSEKLWQASPITTTKTLQQAVRDNLPKALDLASAFRTLQTIVKQPTVPREITQAFKQLQQSSPRPEHLSDPKILKQVVKNSGVLWEASVRENINRITQNHETPPANNSLIFQSTQSQRAPTLQFTSAFDKVLRQLLAPRNHNPQTNRSAVAPPITDRPLVKRQAQSPSSNQPTAEGKQLSPDIKSQLLLIKQLTQTLLKPATQKNSDSSKAPQQPSTDKAFLLNPSTRRQTKNVDAKAQQQAIQRIQQQVIASLAKIQLQQSQSLLQQAQSASDGKAPANILQLEIPVQLHGDFHNLRLQLEEDWIERETEEQENQQAKRWRVNLCVELPDAGHFYACVTHIDNETEVQLWAEQSSTANKVRENMATLQARLQQQGINVRALTCEVGAPANQQMHNQLSCSLVDVRT